LSLCAGQKKRAAQWRPEFREETPQKASDMAGKVPYRRSGYRTCERLARRRAAEIQEKSAFAWLCGCAAKDYHKWSPDLFLRIRKSQFSVILLLYPAGLEGQTCFFHMGLLGAKPVSRRLRQTQ
jgi:hypothetical protein